MRALVVYCHPSEGSFNAAVRDLVLAKLREAGAEVRLNDLYARGFQPVLTPTEWTGYLETARQSRRPSAAGCGGHPAGATR